MKCLLVVLIFFLSFSRLAVAKKQISISFDDAPMWSRYFRSKLERAKVLTKKLKKHGVKQAIFYANPGKIKSGQDLEVLKYYKNSGHLIGNHTWSHPDIKKIEVAAYLDDFDKADEYLKDEKLLSPYFRYPFLRRGKNTSEIASIRGHVLGKGYIDGYVTIDNYDFYMNHQFNQALKEARKINFENLRKYYVETLLKGVEYYYKLGKKILNKDIKHIMLLHENDLAALFIGDFILALQKNGWEIIKTEESYENNPLNMYPETLFHGSGRVVSIAKSIAPSQNYRSGYENESVLDKLAESYQIFVEKK